MTVPVDVDNGTNPPPDLSQLPDLRRCERVENVAAHGPHMPRGGPDDARPPGLVVLVNGASGGVGSFAIQLLATRGVSVVATGTRYDAERLTKLGAALVIDFSASPVAEQVRARYPSGVDALINLAGHREDDVPLAAVRRGGKVASTMQVPSWATLSAAGLTDGAVFAAPTREVISGLADLVIAGTLTVDVATVLPFERADAGLQLLQSGQAHGKIVVTLDRG